MSDLKNAQVKAMPGCAVMILLFVVLFLSGSPWWVYVATVFGLIGLNYWVASQQGNKDA
jgi:hypothetical protein